MTAPYIRTIGRADGWELLVTYDGVEYTLGAPRRNGRRRAKIGAHDCKQLEDHLRRAAARFGWAAAIQAEQDGVDLLDVAPAPVVPPPAEVEPVEKQAGTEGV